MQDEKPEQSALLWKKAAAFLASVLLLSVLVFYISRLAPGDPLVSYYGDRVEKMTPEERAWAEEKIGTEGSHFRTVYPLGRQCIAWGFRNFVQI